jgi:hypothetical protein
LAINTENDKNLEFLSKTVFSVNFGQHLLSLLSKELKVLKIGSVHRSGKNTAKAAL